MTTSLPNENLTYLQNGEPVSGGTGGDSSGILNRPLVQIHANVDAVRDALDTEISTRSSLSTEVTNARGTMENLDARLDVSLNNDGTVKTGAIPTYPQTLSELSMATRDVAYKNIPSGFLNVGLEQLMFEGHNYWYTGGADDLAGRGSLYSTFFTNTLGNVITDDANNLYVGFNPKPLFVQGREITLENRPGKAAHAIINFPAAPSTGSRQDFAFVEVWKEKVAVGSSDDVLFPYGAVFYEGTTTAEGTATTNSNMTVTGNVPAYMTAGNHGYYILANNAAVHTFIQNPVNNCFVDKDGQVYQWRWRIRTVAGVSAGTEFAHDDTTNIFVQGKFATTDGQGFAAHNGYASRGIQADAGCSWIASPTTYGDFDGYVYAIPLCKVHRRNTTAWSLSNPNGAGAIGGTSGRPDGKFYDHIHYDDVVDLRNHVSISNLHDYKNLYETTLTKLLNSDLNTNWEHVKSDTDGNGTFKDLNIYSTKPLRPEGLVGSVPFDSSYEITTRLTSSNGVSTVLDGFRNYFSDIPGDQAILGKVASVASDGATPTGFFTYVASSRTLTMDATNMSSGAAGQSSTYKTLISTRKPHIKWSAKRSGAASTENTPEVAGVWSNLGTSSASFVVDDVTSVYFYTSTNASSVASGDVYRTPGGVDVTVAGGKSTDNSNLSGTYTTNSNLEGATGTWTKQSGSGPANLTVTSASVGYKHYSFRTSDAAVSYIGEGSNLHASDGMFINAYVSFTQGSGFLTRVPYRNNLSVKASQFWVNIGGTQTQVLPNNGFGFVPFGNSVDPVNEGTVPSDSHTKSFGMQGFVYTGAVMGVGTEPNGYNSNNSLYSCIIKDGSTYKMWFTGVSATYNGRILYSTSADGITWSTPVLAMNVGTEPNGYNASSSQMPSVIKDGSTYKMWFGGYSASSVWRILYSTSADGITWSTPVLAMNVGPESNGYNSAQSYAQSVIKDGSTYKMWFSGSNGSNSRILYSTSADGITWSTPVLAMNVGTEPHGYNAVHCEDPVVIKDGSTYKMFFAGYQYTDSKWKAFYSTSADGITWSTPVLIYPTGVNPNLYDSGHSFISAVIKDGSTYKIWQSVFDNYNWRIGHAVLTMTDTANSGSSLLGVYDTEGTLNFAPPANSQVITWYESRAVAIDATTLNTTQTYSPVYLTGKIINTTVGSAARYPVLWNSIDLVDVLYPTDSWSLKFDDLESLYSGGSEMLGSHSSTSNYLKITQGSYDAFDQGYMVDYPKSSSVGQSYPLNGLYLAGSFSSVIPGSCQDSLGVTLGGGFVGWNKFASALIKLSSNSIKMLMSGSSLDRATGASCKFINLLGRPLTK